ncbi:hypothetical protein N9Y00_11755 [Tateyamaria sp.]|jgi:hypothetical protein|nr:hypothetical protein [Tateyamaria sp.]
MAFFPAKYFRYSTKYPQSGSRIQLGRSYQFDTPPEAPDQRIFVLKLQGMKYFLGGQGNLNANIEPDRNMLALENFYNDHKRAVSFTFVHPVYGALTCKFNNPLEIPEGITGGDGALPEFEVELIELP